jgi:paraquat-inducible protein B
MNTLIYTQGKHMTKNDTKQPYYLLAPIALLLGFALAKPVLANTDIDTQAATSAVSRVLHETQNAITQLRIDPNTSLVSVKQAIAAIEMIEGSYAHNTVTHTNSKYNTEVANSYEHFYPKLDEQILKNINSLPTLSYKINSDIVYKGSNENLHTTDAFLDYTLAKASLITAMNAIKGNDSLEAMANLRRVFEAVYLAPDFNVSEGNNG